MDTLKQYKLLQTTIDIIVFYSANYAGHKLTDKIHKPDLVHSLIFGTVDLLNKNGILIKNPSYLESFGIEYIKGMDFNNLRNVYTSLLSFVIMTIYDWGVEKHSLGNSLMQSLIKNAVGLAGNSLVDNFILPAEWK